YRRVRRPLRSGVLDRALLQIIHCNSLARKLAISVKVGVSSKVEAIHPKASLEARSTGIHGDLFANNDGTVLVSVHIEAPGQVLEFVRARAGLCPNPHTYVTGSGRRVVVQDFGTIALPEIKAFIHH